MSKKYVYLFSEGNAGMRELLGGKGANLAEMSNIGLPVPQGFTITTEACTQYYEDGRKINDEIMAEIMKNVEGYTLEARLLVATAAGKSVAELLRDINLYTTAAIDAEVQELTRRRLAGEPVAYITGAWEF